MVHVSATLSTSIMVLTGPKIRDMGPGEERGRTLGHIPVGGITLEASPIAPRERERERDGSAQPQPPKRKKHCSILRRTLAQVRHTHPGLDAAGDLAHRRGLASQRHHGMHPRQKARESQAKLDATGGACTGDLLLL